MLIFVSLISNKQFKGFHEEKKQFIRKHCVATHKMKHDKEEIIIYLYNKQSIILPLWSTWGLAFEGCEANRSTYQQHLLYKKKLFIFIIKMHHTGSKVASHRFQSI